MFIDFEIFAPTQRLFQPPRLLERREYASLSFPLTSQTPTNNVVRVNAKKSLENQRSKGLFYGGEKNMKES